MIKELMILLQQQADIPSLQTIVAIFGVVVMLVTAFNTFQQAKIQNAIGEIKLDLLKMADRIQEKFDKKLDERFTRSEAEIKDTLGRLVTKESFIALQERVRRLEKQSRDDDDLQ